MSIRLFDTKYYENIKDIKLIRSELYVHKDDCVAERLYIRLDYSYLDKKGNKHVRTIPKIKLPFSPKELPIIDVNCELSAALIPSTCTKIPIFGGCLDVLKTDFTVIGEGGKPIRVEGAYTADIVVERAAKKMTVKEIEEKLGYKIEIVSDEEDKK